MKEPYRPKLKIKKTNTEWIWDIVGGGIFLAMLFFLMMKWSDLPAEIPTHFNVAGEADRWGSKGTIITLPIIAIFMWVMMSVIERYPHTHNYPDRLNEQNVHAFYLSSRKLLNKTKNICLLLFSYILYQQVKGAILGISTFSPLFIVVFFLALIVPIIWHVIERSKIK